MGDEPPNDDELHVRLPSQLKRTARMQAGARDKPLSAYVRDLIREDRERNPPGELILDD